MCLTIFLGSMPDGADEPPVVLEPMGFEPVMPLGWDLLSRSPASPEWFMFDTSDGLLDDPWWP